MRMLAALACLGGLFFTGCTSLPPRLNHPYSASNATKANSASSSFGDTVSTNSGVTTKIIAAIGDEKNLTQTADALRERLKETAFADAVNTKSWLGLRAKMWKDFGVISEPQQRALDEAGDSADVDKLQTIIQQADNDVATHISNRTNKVQAIAKVLEILAQGQAALAKNAAKQASNSLGDLAKLTNSTAATVTNISAVNTNLATSADLLEFLQRALVTAGQQLASNTMVLSNATTLQKLILNQAESSRDPASAYSLVAVVGSGLGTNDLLLLDTYLTYLQAALTNQLQGVTNASVTAENSTTNRSTHAGGPPSPAAESELNEAPENAVKRLVILSYKRPQSLAPEAPDPLAPQIASLAHEKSLPGPEERFRKSYLELFPLLARLTDSALAGAEFPQLQMPQSTGSTPEGPNPVTLDSILTNVPIAVNDIVSAAKELQINITGIQTLLNDTNTINIFTSALADISNGKPDGTNVLNALLNSAMLDPALAKFFNQNLPSNIVSQISGIANDIVSQENAAGARLLAFFGQLSQAQASLYQENARHYTMLGGISKREIERWYWIEQVYERNSSLYSIVTNTSWGELIKSRNITVSDPALFLTKDTLKAFPGFYNARVQTLAQADRGYSNVWKLNTSFPEIGIADNIHSSLQLLAETAKELQKGSPSEIDPIALRGVIAQARFSQAIELVLNSDFVINYNVRQGDTLNRMLLEEIKEHSATIDGIELETSEANIRLQIGNSIAFHSTGVTDADIQALISALQTAALGYISGKQ